MYEATIMAPGIEDRTYHCRDANELRNLVYGVLRAQGVTVRSDRELVADISAARSAADTGRTGVVGAGLCAVGIREPEDPDEFACQGHESLYVGLGEVAYCDGTCRPRTTWTVRSIADLCCALDDADLDGSGGCGACGLEAGQMCVGCGRCNCHTHRTCVRPAGSPASAL